MARLRSPTGELLWVCAHHTIGRHPDNHLVVHQDQVSRHQSVLSWNGSQWVMRDLGSRNGSWVNGVRMPTAGQQAVFAGARISVAPPAEWVLEDDGPPQPMAIEAGSGQVCVGADLVLGFPDPDDPVAVIVRGQSGWMLEETGCAQEVADGDRVEVAGKQWRLSLPNWAGATLSGPWAYPLSLTFFVSRDEEHVQIEVGSPSQTTRVRNRVHHYTLLLLARQRLADIEAGVAPVEQGWMAQSDLERMLRLDRNVVYQHLYRARRELAGLVEGSDVEVIERRHDAGQLRIGFDHLSIGSLPGR